MQMITGGLCLGLIVGLSVQSLDVGTALFWGALVGLFAPRKWAQI